MRQIKKQDFVDVMPKLGDNSCDVVFYKFPMFMKTLSNWFRWAFNENGEISKEFGKLICANKCLYLEDTCPKVDIKLDILPSDTSLSINIQGDFTTDYSYILYISEIKNPKSWRKIVSTGRTVNKDLNIIVNNLVKDTTYYFKFVLQKRYCEDIVYFFESKTLNCEVITFDVKGYHDKSIPANVLEVNRTNSDQGFSLGTFWKCFRSEGAANKPAKLIKYGNISDDSYAPNGLIGIKIIDTDLKANTDYYYQIKITTANTCGDMTTANKTLIHSGSLETEEGGGEIYNPELELITIDNRDILNDIENIEPFWLKSDISIIYNEPAKKEIQYSLLTRRFAFSSPVKITFDIRINCLRIAPIMFVMLGITYDLSELQLYFDRENQRQINGVYTLPHGLLLWGSSNFTLSNNILSYKKEIDLTPLFSKGLSTIISRSQYQVPNGNFNTPDWTEAKAFFTFSFAYKIWTKEFPSTNSIRNVFTYKFCKVGTFI